MWRVTVQQETAWFLEMNKLLQARAVGSNYISSSLYIVYMDFPASNILGNYTQKNINFLQDNLLLNSCKLWLITQSNGTNGCLQPVSCSFNK